MVERKPSKLHTRVRFPSPAPTFLRLCPLSPRLSLVSLRVHEFAPWDCVPRLPAATAAPISRAAAAHHGNAVEPGATRLAAVCLSRTESSPAGERDAWRFPALG